MVFFFLILEVVVEVFSPLTSAASSEMGSVDIASVSEWDPELLSPVAASAETTKNKKNTSLAILFTDFYTAMESNHSEILFFRR